VGGAGRRRRRSRLGGLVILRGCWQQAAAGGRRAATPLALWSLSAKQLTLSRTRAQKTPVSGIKNEWRRLWRAKLSVTSAHQSKSAAAAAQLEKAAKYPCGLGVSTGGHRGRRQNNRRRRRLNGRSWRRQKITAGRRNLAAGAEQKKKNSRKTCSLANQAPLLYGAHM